MPGETLIVLFSISTEDLSHETISSRRCRPADQRALLHHRYNKKSSRDVYGGMWADYTVLILRHQKVH